MLASRRTSMTARFRAQVLKCCAATAVAGVVTACLPAILFLFSGSSQPVFALQDSQTAPRPAPKPVRDAAALSNGKPSPNSATQSDASGARVVETRPVIATVANDDGNIIGVTCEILPEVELELRGDPHTVEAVLSRTLTVSLVSTATPRVSQAQRQTGNLQTGVSPAAVPSQEIPLRGTWAVTDGKIRFMPRFRFLNGRTYRARFHRSNSHGSNSHSGQPNSAEPLTNDPESGSDIGSGSAPEPRLGSEANSDVVFEFKVGEKSPHPPATVIAVYPTTEIVPENLLRFYVHFSRPMARGNVYSHVRLLTAEGNEVDLPFLELGEEFWDPQQQRLTLLLDPGRIKQDVKPREDVGPALTVNTQMTLVIRDTICDSENRPIQSDFVHRFRVAPPVREAMDLTSWKVSPVVAGTKAPLVIDFPAPLDHALLEHAIQVVSADGTSISGTVTSSNHDRRWQFVPDSVWRSGDHSLRIETILEDLAGNRIGRPFEVDELTPITREITAEFATIPFTIPADR